MNKLLLAIAIVFISTQGIKAQNNPFEKDPWTKNQLMAPAHLAALIKNPKAKKPLIFNIGVVDDIKGAQRIGPTAESANLEKFRKYLSKLPKNTPIVIYCGCCPFSRCPNIRPAFKLLSEMKFTQASLLNLPTNLKTDWINKGFPLN